MKRAPKEPPAVVLPVGGGKGGIGKSAVAASLGLALSRLEHRVTLMDADLGGSDLHNLLGLDNDRPGIGELLTTRGMVLADVVYSTAEPGLSFVPGDAMVVGAANPGFQKKRKLLNAIGRFPADFILLDLGAGTSLTVMDFFLAGPVSLVVMLPERPAVLSAFNFLKNAVFRALDRILRDNAKTAAVLAQYRSRSRGPGSMDMAELLASLARVNPGQGARATEAVARLRPKLIVNRVHKVDDFAHAGALARRVKQDLGLEVEVLGFLPEDEVVRQGAQERRVALELDPRAPFCQAITLCALKIAPWAGRGGQWQAHRAFDGSFERAATEFSPLFPPPGQGIPTRSELLARLAALEIKHQL